MNVDEIERELKNLCDDIWDEVKAGGTGEKAIDREQANADHIKNVSKANDGADPVTEVNAQSEFDKAFATMLETKDPKLCSQAVNYCLTQLVKNPNLAGDWTWEEVIQLTNAHSALNQDSFKGMRTQLEHAFNKANQTYRNEPIYEAEQGTKGSEPVTPRAAAENLGYPQNTADPNFWFSPEKFEAMFKTEAWKNFAANYAKAEQKGSEDVEQMSYQRCKCTSGGKTIEYKTATESVDWGNYFKSAKTEAKDAPATNLSLLSDFITAQIERYYGGWGRIKSIIVRSQQLIINNVCYKPAIDQSIIGNADYFPLDIADYLSEGAMAGVFDWGKLRKMTGLTTLDIDDIDFYLTTVLGDLGVGRRGGLTTIFKAVPNLYTFILAGKEIGVDEQHTEKTFSIKRELARHRKFLKFSDGFEINVRKGTNWGWNWSAGNFKRYCENRGNRGLLRFGVGVLGRAALAGTLGILNIASHIGGMFTDFIFRDAITDVSMEDVT